MHRFIPLLAERMGARVTQSDVRHHPRTYGKSKYGLERTFKVISDLFKLLNEKNRTALDIRKPYELEIACHPAVSLNPDTVEAQAV
jgi:hypothetical protein